MDGVLQVNMLIWSFTPEQAIHRSLSRHHWVKAGYTLDKLAVCHRPDIYTTYKQPFTLTFFGNLTNKHVFGGSRSTRKNQNQHRETMQTPHREALT